MLWRSHIFFHIPCCRFCVFYLISFFLSLFSLSLFFFLAREEFRFEDGGVAGDNVRVVVTDPMIVATQCLILLWSTSSGTETYSMISDFLRCLLPAYIKLATSILGVCGTSLLALGIMNGDAGVKALRPTSCIILGKPIVCVFVVLRKPRTRDA